MICYEVRYAMRFDRTSFFKHMEAHFDRSILISVCSDLRYGYKIMRAIGVKLAVITPSRGFAIELGAAIVIIIGSYLGLPLSTTHCQVFI